jgi:hypothetical protein
MWRCLEPVEEEETSGPGLKSQNWEAREKRETWDARLASPLLSRYLLRSTIKDSSFTLARRTTTPLQARGISNDVLRCDAGDHRSLSP